MTSRLTISALVFSILSTATLVSVANAQPQGKEPTATRVIQLERVTIVAPRLSSAARPARW